MAISVTSTPVSIPSGIRATKGHFDANGATYATAGFVTTAAQWGGGSNGIPARFPDFVIFNPGTSTDADATTSHTIFRYNGGGLVQISGEEALVADVGLTEMDVEAANNSADYLAIWVTPDPAGITTA